MLYCLDIEYRTWQPTVGWVGQLVCIWTCPSAVRYELKPEYDRFVALAGIADNMLDHELGRNLAMHCSVVFRVFIDGQQAAESPVMRISQEPWRFDVPIPPGGRFINLVCMDAGSRNILDLGNWVEAGFVRKETK
jgi:hypothetical protein